MFSKTVPFIIKTNLTNKDRVVAPVYNNELINLQSLNNALFQIQIHVLQGDFSKFWCGLVKIFICCLSAFEVITPFQNTYLCEAGFPQ